MIAYAITLVTTMETITTASMVEVAIGTDQLVIRGSMVRDFVRCTNHAYHDYPYYDCLTMGLELVPPELRSIFRYLYETLKEVFVWNEDQC